jgi:DNA invertase Pin-like site-specific DNA recombinase
MPYKTGGGRAPQRSGSTIYIDGPNSTVVQARPRKPQLTDDERTLIHKLYSEGWSQQQLADHFDRTQAGICYVLQGKTNGPSTRGRPPGAPAGEKHPAARLTEHDVRLLRRMHAEGELSGREAREVARTLGVGLSTIYAAVTRKTWKHVV